ncbi:MAG TPA: hypothetical protein VK957_06245, partial [Lunatimonas sp.]|nr:hypothetical protein [Lunatimonas sp.]
MAKKKSNKLLFILLGVIVVLIVGILVGKSQGWIGGPKETEVETAKVGYRNIVEKVSASGVVQP